jgi:hypothetical protein
LAALRLDLARLRLASSPLVAVTSGHSFLGLTSSGLSSRGLGDPAPSSKSLPELELDSGKLWIVRKGTGIIPAQRPAKVDPL